MYQKHIPKPPQTIRNLPKPSETVRNHSKPSENGPKPFEKIRKRSKTARNHPQPSGGRPRKRFTRVQVVTARYGRRDIRSGNQDFRGFREVFGRRRRRKLFGMIDLIAASDSVEFSSKSKLSSRFFFFCFLSSFAFLKNLLRCDCNQFFVNCSVCPARHEMVVSILCLPLHGNIPTVNGYFLCKGDGWETK